MSLFTIAEVGSNWRNFEDCEKSIYAAKDAGASAVKFQMFTMKELFGPWDETKSPFELPREWVPNLSKICRLAGIEFLCTAFSVEGYEYVDKWVSRHKIASSEMSHLDILKKVSEFGKPVILSTGAHYFQEIVEATRILNRLYGNDSIALLYCSVEYPASDTKLERINKLKTITKTVGFSDHSLGDENAISAFKDYGISILEKHVTLIPEIKTPDQPHSLTFEQFGEMVKKINAINSDVAFDIPEAERFARSTWRRRVVATRDIKKGELIDESNTGRFRLRQSDTSENGNALGFSFRVAERDYLRGEVV